MMLFILGLLFGVAGSYIFWTFSRKSKDYDGDLYIDSTSGYSYSGSVYVAWEDPDRMKKPEVTFRVVKRKHIQGLKPLN